LVVAAPWQVLFVDSLVDSAMVVVEALGVCVDSQQGHLKQTHLEAGECLTGRASRRLEWT
jgi:hypothetical protein